jgi:DNA-binding response OmpR family regulator
VEVARRIREGSNAAIIVLSARGRETDKIEALDAGADDYLAQLRHKLEVDPARPRYLPTETGGGYRIPLP